MWSSLLLLALFAAPPDEPLALIEAPAEGIEAAPAPPEEPAHRVPRNRVQLDLGLYAALGYGGATYTRALGSRLAIDAGLGYGMTGLSVSAMPRLFLGSGRHRFTAGLGLAVSAPVGEPFERVTGPVLWLNADVLGYELRTDDGFSASTAVGVTASLSGEQHIATCMEDCRAEGGKVMWPQWRAAIGYWF